MGSYLSGTAFSVTPFKLSGGDWQIKYSTLG